jgi:hypothetical protein
MRTHCEMCEYFKPAHGKFYCTHPEIEGDEIDPTLPVPCFLYEKRDDA